MTVTGILQLYIFMMVIVAMCVSTPFHWHGAELGENMT